MSSFQEYFIDIFNNDYANFTGRVRRKEFWHFFLFHIIVSIVLLMLSLLIMTVLGDFSAVKTIGFFVFASYLLASIIPSLGLVVRRLHDTNKSGWLYLISFIPFGSLVLLVFYCIEGTSGPNQYGPDPKDEGHVTESDHLLSDEL